MDQQFFVRLGGSVLFPISFGQLQQLAASGSLAKTDLVSLDGEEFVAAERIADLVFHAVRAERSANVDEYANSGAQASSSITDLHPLTETIVPSTNDILSEPEPNSRLTWPVIRVRSRGWGTKHEIVRLERDGISFLSTNQELSDELLTSDTVGVKRSTWARVSRNDIRFITVARVGYLTTCSWWLRFQVNTNRRTHRFRVPLRESPNVIAALRSLAGDRFRDRAKRGPSYDDLFLALVCVLFLGFAVLPMIFRPVLRVEEPAEFEGISTSEPVIREEKLPVLVLAIMVLLFSGFLALCYLPLAMIRHYSPYRLTHAPPRRRRRATGRRPLRSAPIGWGLKLIGMSYILYILYNSQFRHIQPAGMHLALDGVISAFLCAPGFVAMFVGYRLCLRTFEPKSVSDVRPPVLFLRSFDDDGKLSFQPSGWLAKLHGIFRHRDVLVANLAIPIHPTKLLKVLFNVETHSAEELLAASFRGLGPFVAIGRPGEILATPGAERMYVPDAEWQAVVNYYLERSQAVILQPAQSDGVRWEIERVFAQVPRHQVLISMLNFKDHPDAYEDFRARLAAEHGVRLPLSLPYFKMPCFAHFERDGTLRLQPVWYRTPLLWTFLGNAVDTDRTFHAFIQKLHGRQQDSPYRSTDQTSRERTTFRLHAAFSVPIAISVAVTFYFLVTAIPGVLSGLLR